MPSTPDDATPAEANAIVERNWAFETMPLDAKEAFLDELVRARESGLDANGAWSRALEAAQSAYPPKPPTPPSTSLYPE